VVTRFDLLQLQWTCPCASFGQHRNQGVTYCLAVFLWDLHGNLHLLLCSEYKSEMHCTGLGSVTCIHGWRLYKHILCNEYDFTPYYNWRCGTRPTDSLAHSYISSIIFSSSCSSSFKAVGLRCMHVSIALCGYLKESVYPSVWESVAEWSVMSCVGLSLGQSGVVSPVFDT